MFEYAQEVRPLDLLDVSPASKRQSAALVILNQPIADIPLLARLWNNTDYRVCADGGANRLYDLFVSEDETVRKNYLPTIVHGDLDSLRDDVRDYYSGHGVEITQDPDQYSTDFQKAIKQIFRARKRVHDVAVLGTIAGRLDQGIGLLSEFYREQLSRQRPDFRLWLFSESSISFILTKGKTVIFTPLSGKLITENIGILPVYGPACITTQGLEWDVESWPTSMGSQVSTSNHISRDEITVSTDTEVLFTVERQCFGTG